MASELHVTCEQHGHVGTYRSMSDRANLSAKQAAKGHVGKKDCTLADLDIDEVPFSFPWTRRTS